MQPYYHVKILLCNFEMVRSTQKICISPILSVSACLYTDSSKSVVLCCVAAVWPTPHRLLNGAVILADVVDDARDAERTGEAQQVGQEAECDAEDERSAKCFPQGLPDQLWAQGCCALRPLREDKKKEKGGQRWKYISMLSEIHRGEIRC